MSPLVNFTAFLFSASIIIKISNSTSLNNSLHGKLADYIETVK